MYDGLHQNEIVFLPSKINAPSLTVNVIERPLLNTRFAQTLRCPLTTVVSSAGFGKTTAVLSWAKTITETPIAWYHLDDEDCSVDRFWLYLTAALRIADKGICQAFDEMGLSDDISAMKLVLDALIIQLSEYGRDFVCVLEDFHTVHEEPAIQETMQYFLKHLPSNAHMVITSRQLIRLPTAKLNIGGLLNEINESDLSFAVNEIHQFFQEMGIVLNKIDSELIFDITRGWPTGTKLIALLCGQGSNEEINEALALAQNSINDYLFEEVFSDLEKELQEFLLATSVVSSFCPSLAEDITGLTRNKVVQFIDRLVQYDLFIERIERKKSEEWYRYHLLFSEMLHHSLLRLDGEQVDGMRRTAQNWFSKHGFYDYVVEISADLNDYEQIRQVIFNNWKSFYMGDSTYTLIRWASLLPREEILRSPLLCAILAMPYAIKGDFEKANECIKNAIESLHSKEDYLFAFCMAQKAYVSVLQSEMDDVQHFASKALEFFPEDEFYLRSMMHQITAAAQCYGAPLEAKHSFIRSIELQNSYSNKSLSASGYCNVSVICANLGHFAEARYYADLALDLYEERERRHKPMLTYAYLATMILMYEQGDLEEARKAYTSFSLAAREGAVLARKAEAEVIYAKILYQMDDPSAKQVFFRALTINEEGALEGFPTLDMAKDYAETFGATTLERSHRFSVSVHARLFDYALRYHLNDESCYEDVYNLYELIEPGQHYAKLYAAILAVLFMDRHMLCAEADALFCQILLCANEQNMSQILKDNRTYLQNLVSRFDLASASEAEARYYKETFQEHPTHLKRHNLTDRELEVIELIASGLSIAEAAGKMYVSRDTIKKHLANLYGKLGVHSKTQAIATLKNKGIL